MFDSDSDHFLLESISPSPENPLLISSNLNTLIRQLDIYFKEIVKRKSPVDQINPKLIAERNEGEEFENELLHLCEVVIGVAILSPQRQLYVQKIMSLSIEDQTQLKGVIERMMKLESVDDETKDEIETKQDEEKREEEVKGLQDQLKQLHHSLATRDQEVFELEGVVSSLTRENEELESQVGGGGEKEEEWGKEREQLNHEISSLRNQLVEARSDLRESENGRIEQEERMEELDRGVRAGGEERERLEEQIHVLSDQLEIERGKSSR